MNILLVQTGFLGDVILSTPVISNLKKLYPKSRLSVLTTKEALDLVRFHPEVDRVISFDKRGEDRGVRGLFRTAERLRKEQFDVVFSLHKSWRTAALLSLSRIAKRYGFREASAAFSYTNTVRRKGRSHEILRNLAILENVGGVLDGVEQKAHIEVPTDVSSGLLQRFSEFKNKPVIGIAPGSVWATKRWTVEGFAKVTAFFQKQGYQVALVGGPADREVACQIEEQLSEPVLNLVGELSLIESVAAIEKFVFLISNDSAPLHMASATGTPVVAVFCATVPEFGYGPWEVPCEVVGLDGLDCRPCGRHGGKTCPTGTHACQIGLAPQVVIRACERLLEQIEGQDRGKRVG